MMDLSYPILSFLLVCAQIWTLQECWISFSYFHKSIFKHFSIWWADVGYRLSSLIVKIFVFKHRLIDEGPESRSMEHFKIYMFTYILKSIWHIKLKFYRNHYMWPNFGKAEGRFWFEMEWPGNKYTFIVNPLEECHRTNTWA